MLLTVERDADAGVGHRHVQQDDIVRNRLFSRDAKNDFAVLGELDRVPDQVDDDLAQASGVAPDHGRQERVDVDDQFQPLLMRAQRHGARRVADRIAKVVVDRVELELARLHP